MKKFTSILCALAIVLSVNAVPFKAEKLATFSKVEKVEKKADFAKKQVSAQKPVQKIDFAKAEKQKKADFAKGPKTNEIKPIRKAKLTTTNVEIQGLSTEYDDEDGTFTYVLAGPDRYFIFSFASEGTDPVEDGKTYKLTDMTDAYWYAGYYDWSDFESCSFTKTTVGGKIKITATATDEEGDVWNLSYDESNVPDCPAGGTFVADGVSSEYYAYFSEIEYELTVSESRLVFNFDIKLPETASDVESGKTYTIDDMDPEYTYVQFNKVTYLDAEKASFTKTVAADGSYTVAATIVDVNGNTWNISATKAAPVVRDSALTLNGTYEEGSYYSQVEAANADSSQYVSLILFGTLEAGDLDFDDLLYPTVRLVDGEDYVFYDLTEGELKVTYDAESNKFSIKGTALGVNEDDDLDYINFTLDLTIDGKAPIVPTRQENLTLSGLNFDIYSSAWQLYGYNADSTTYISLAANSTAAITGAYATSELIADYSYIVTDIEGTSYNYYSLGEADLVVVYTEADNSVVVTGSFIGESETEAVEFILNLSGATPAVDPQTEYVTFEMKDMTVTQDETYWDIKGTDPNTNYFLEIRSKAAEVAATYTEADLDDFWTYVGTGNQVFFDIYEANVTVTLADNLLSVKGSMTFVEASTKDTIYATVDVAGIADGKKHPDYDATEDDYIIDFTDVSVDNSKIASAGTVTVAGENEELMAYIKLIFYVGKDAPAVNAGVYPISAEHTVGTVGAGEGLDGSSLVGSFAAYYNASGYIITPIWWPVSGTVTVSETGIITVDALNSYDKLIKCVLGEEEPQAINNTETANKVAKRLVNGQLVIEKNGVQYNVVGAELK